LKTASCCQTGSYPDIILILCFRFSRSSRAISGGSSHSGGVVRFSGVFPIALKVRQLRSRPYVLGHIEILVKKFLFSQKEGACCNWGALKIRRPHKRLVFKTDLFHQCQEILPRYSTPLSPEPALNSLLFVDRQRPYQDLVGNHHFSVRL